MLLLKDQNISTYIGSVKRENFLLKYREKIWNTFPDFQIIRSWVFAVHSYEAFRSIDQ